MEEVKRWKMLTHTNQYGYIKVRGFILVSNYGDAVYVGKNPRKGSDIIEGIKINNDGRRHLGKYMIYQMVADCFVDKSRAAALCEKPQAHHKDFDKTNDRADNLEWLTPSEHMRIHNLHSKPGVKFTKEHSRKISVANSKKRWIHKGNERTMVDLDEIEKYLAKGWERGMKNKIKYKS